MDVARHMGLREVHVTINLVSQFVHGRDSLWFHDLFGRDQIGFHGLSWYLERSRFVDYAGIVNGVGFVVLLVYGRSWGRETF